MMYHDVVRTRLSEYIGLPNTYLFDQEYNIITGFLNHTLTATLKIVQR